MTYFITLFLEPGWINWSIFWLTEKFKTIWILVSNVVYFIFAWIIIWIAFMNILGKWDKWELKQSLPKFIIWVLIVPFSWFFIQFVLSLSSILTVSALSLPYDTFSEYKTIYDSVEFKKNCVINLNYGSEKNPDVWPPEENVGKFFYCTWDKVKLSTSLQTSTFWLISIYTYWILNLEKLSDISKPEIDKETITNIWDLIVKVVFNFLFVIVYMLLLVTLWIVLAVRWMYLWIYMMISPVFWLIYFFDKGEWWWESVLSKFNIKQFLSLALIPVYVTLALTFWLLFIQTIWAWITSSVPNQKAVLEKWTNWQEGYNTFNISGYTLEIQWPIWDNSEDKESALNKLVLVWEWVLWTIWTLIVYFIWVAVLRIAVMAALRSSEVTKALVEPVYNFGNQVWQLIAKSPQYAPIIPWWFSMKWMEKIWSMPINALEQKASNRVSWMQWWINKFFWADSVDIAKSTKIKSMLNTWWIDSEVELKELQKEIKWLIDKHWTDNSEVRNLMALFVEKAKGRMWITDGDQKIENLFKDSKLSAKWYWLLNVTWFSDSVNSYSANAEAYAASHKNWWWADEKSDVKKEWEGGYINDKQVIQLKKWAGYNLDVSASWWEILKPEIKTVQDINLAIKQNKIKKKRDI
jgi:hypothetical protein